MVAVRTRLTLGNVKIVRLGEWLLTYTSPTRKLTSA